MAGGAAGCNDEVKAIQAGEVELGFPLRYVMKTSTKQGEQEVRAEVTAFSTGTLDAALFEVPPDYRAAGAGKLLSPPEVQAVPKTPGKVLVGVVAPVNRTGRPFAVTGFQQQLAAHLSKEHLDSTILDSPGCATQTQCDYVMETEVLSIQKTAVAKVGGLLSKASKFNPMGGGTAPQEIFEAKLSYRLTKSDGNAVGSGSVSAKNASDLNLKTAISLATTAMSFTGMGMMMNGMMFNPGMINSYMNMAGSPIGGGFVDPSMIAYMRMAKGLENRAAGGPALGNDESAAVNNALGAAVKAVLPAMK